MKRTLKIALSLALPVLVFPTFAQSADAIAACEKVKSFAIDGVSITSADTVAAGKLKLDDTSLDVAHCRLFAG